MDKSWAKHLLQRLHLEDFPMSPRVHRVSHSLLAKRAEPSERASMDYVLEKLTSIVKAGDAQQLIQPDSIQLRKLGRLWTSFRHALGAQ